MGSCYVLVFEGKEIQNRQLVLYRNGAVGIKSCQKVCNAILIVALRCILVGPLCSVSCTGLVLLVLEMEDF